MKRGRLPVAGIGILDRMTGKLRARDYPPALEPARGRRPPRMRHAEATRLLRQLASLLKAGLPLAPALQVLQTTATRHDIRRLLIEVYRDVSKGQALSKALSRHPRAFGHLCCTLVAVGETSGALCEVLFRIAAQREGRWLDTPRARAVSTTRDARGRRTRS